VGYASIDGPGPLREDTPLRVCDYVQHVTEGWIGVVYTLRCLRCSQPVVDGRVCCHVNMPQVELHVWDGGGMKSFQAMTATIKNGKVVLDLPFKLLFIGPRDCAWGKILNDASPFD
jgi:hypothetical protein